jgi:hypothetical protein
MLVVDLTVAALIWHPVGREGGFEALTGDVEQAFVLGKGHSEGLYGILFDFSVGGLVVGVYLFDKRLGLLLFVLFFVELVALGGELSVGCELFSVHSI